MKNRSQVRRRRRRQHQVKNRSQEERRRLTKSYRIQWLIYRMSNTYTRKLGGQRGPTVEGHVPPPPLIATALLQPPQPPAEPELENSCVVQLGTDILQIGMGTMLFILFIPIQIVRTEFHWMGSCVTMATAVRMSNTT